MTEPFPPPAAPVPSLTTAQMREVDRATIEEAGVTLMQMMENAGRALARVAARRFLGGDPRGRRVTVLAGHGVRLRQVERVVPIQGQLINRRQNLERLRSPSLDGGQQASDLCRVRELGSVHEQPVDFTPCLVATAAYLVGVRRREARELRAELQQQLR